MGRSPRRCRGELQNPGAPHVAHRHLRLQDIGGDADGDALGGFPDRVAREVCVARCGFDPADNQQAHVLTRGF